MDGIQDLKNRSVPGKIVTVVISVGSFSHNNKDVKVGKRKHNEKSRTMTAARQANIVCRIGRLRRVTNHNGLLFYRYRYVKRLQAALCLPSKRRALRQFTKQLKGKARHGDPKDAEDYVVEMYNVSYEKEKDCSAKPYLKFEWYFKTRDLTEKMRSILVDWLVDVHNHYSSQPETLYLTVNILDRFLERKEVEPRVLQLAGAASFLIATKYEEELPVTAADMVWISDNIYTNVEVRRSDSRRHGYLAAATDITACVVIFYCIHLCFSNR